MLSPAEALQTRKRNYRQIRELIRLSYALGVNLTAPTPFKDSLRIINVILIVSSVLAMYGNWCELERNMDNIPKLAEAICTALQTIISIVKMVYLLFNQRKFYRLMNEAQTHELLQKIEIFQHNFPGKHELRSEIEMTMKTIWRDVRRQLIFYTICCSGIMCNYFLPPLILNTYHSIKQTPDYVHILPFPAFYAIWADKGMSFPYYHIEMFLTSCALYIAGSCAVCFDCAFTVLCLHAVGLVQVLNLLVKHSTSALVPQERRVEYLRYCIYHYERTYDYVLKIQNMFQHISLSQFVLSLLIFGFVLFEMNFGLESDITTLFRMLMYISAAGTEIIIYCANAQRLKSVSEEIPLAFYSCEWYNESEEFKQMLRMMILRTNRTFQLNVSWFTSMSLATLISLFRMSGSYFLLLRNLQEK